MENHVYGINWGGKWILLMKFKAECKTLDLNPIIRKEINPTTCKLTQFIVYEQGTWDMKIAFENFSLLVFTTWFCNIDLELWSCLNCLSPAITGVWHYSRYYSQFRIRKLWFLKVFIYVYVSVWGYQTPRAKVIGGCELPKVGVGSWTQVLWRSRKGYQPVSHLSRPVTSSKNNLSAE